MPSENFTSWADTKAKAKVIREAAGTQRTDADEAAAINLLRAEVRAYRLAEIRKAQQLTQVEVAQAMGVGQPRVSQIERGDLDVAELPTLRKYVEALGGHLRIVADFGDSSLNLC